MRAAVLLLSDTGLNKTTQEKNSVQFSAYCIFSSCLGTAKLTITKQNIPVGSVIVEVMFTGCTQNVAGEAKAGNII